MRFHSIPNPLLIGSFLLAACPLAASERQVAVLSLHEAFAGKVKSWDVVNEAIDDGGGYLRPSPWLTGIGEDYIAEAFIAARKADPNAELYYNDYGIENPHKREKTLLWCRDLQPKPAFFAVLETAGRSIQCPLPEQP